MKCRIVCILILYLIIFRLLDLVCREQQQSVQISAILALRSLSNLDDLRKVRYLVSTLYVNYLLQMQCKLFTFLNDNKGFRKRRVEDLFLFWGPTLKLTWIQKSLGRHISSDRSSTATGVDKLVEEVTDEAFRLNRLLNDRTTQCSNIFVDKNERNYNQ